jgi:hypothetical protein
MIACQVHTKKYPGHAQRVPSECQTHAKHVSKKKTHTICPPLAKPMPKTCLAHVKRMPNACQTREQGENT